MRLAHEIKETHRRWYELPGSGRHELHAEGSTLVLNVGRHESQKGQDLLVEAVARVAELNARFADWYYVISEDVYKKIHLGRSDIIKEGATARDAGFDVDAFRKLETDGIEKTTPTATAVPMDPAQPLVLVPPAVALGAVDQGDVGGQGLDRYQFFAGEGVGHDPEAGIDRQIRRSQDAPDRQKRRPHAPRLEGPQQRPSGVFQAAEPAGLHRGPEVGGQAVFLQAHLGEVEAVGQSGAHRQINVKAAGGHGDQSQTAASLADEFPDQGHGRGPGVAAQGHQVPVLDQRRGACQVSPDRWHRGLPGWGGPPGGPAG